MHPEWRRICEDYITATSYCCKDELESYFNGRPAFDYATHNPFLNYPQAERHIPLGKPEFPPSPNLWQVIEQRRSKRNFLPDPISLNELNILLWSTQGITGTINRGGEYHLRTVSSAGALYPIETYLLVNNVTDLTPGLYHLDVKNWVLEALKLVEVSEFVYQAALEQEFVRHAAVTFVWTAIIPRCRAKYYERAYRYILWDVGHIAQNLHISGNALNLGICSIGSWYDKVMNDFLGIDGLEHLSILMAGVGKVKGEDWQEDRRSS